MWKADDETEKRLAFLEIAVKRLQNYASTRCWEYTQDATPRPGHGAERLPTPKMAKDFHTYPASHMFDGLPVIGSVWEISEYGYRFEIITCAYGYKSQEFLVVYNWQTKQGRIKPKFPLSMPLVTWFVEAKPVTNEAAKTAVVKPLPFVNSVWKRKADNKEITVVSVLQFGTTFVVNYKPRHHDSFVPMASIHVDDFEHLYTPITTTGA